MGLAFLNKKSWHTGSFQNIEKVWIAEQKENERKRQIKEAQRRLKEERHYEDLKRLQVEAGLIPKSHLQRLDWMYEGGAIKNTSSEEYLLGKPLKSNENSSGEWRPTLFKESTANPGNEVFTKVHEDPMFAIMQEEQRRRKEIMQNPQKMNKVKKEIEKMKKKRKVSDVSSVVSEDSTKSQKKRRERSRYKEIQETEKFAPDWKS
jgi:hypothetical protein